MSRAHFVAFLSVLALACAKDDDPVSTTGAIETADGTTTSNSGDGDGDGDGSTTTDPSTDTGDPTDTTDTGDPTTGTDGCSDGGSGNAPDDDEGVFEAPSEPAEPHGGAFVPDADIGGTNECDVFAQDCPVGEKCVPYASSGVTWDADKCVPVVGSGMVGDPCTYGGVVEATDDCDENSACWGINGEGIGVCTAFCEGSPQAPVCPDGTSCLQGNSGSIAFCVAGCNPLTQECPVGEACFWSNSSFSCTFTTADIPVGMPCGYINDCAEGLACINAANLPNCAGSACCAEFCDLDCGAGVCSQAGTTCVAFFGMGQAPPGDEDVGVCISP